MREKMKFNDLVRMLLVYIFDGRKDETKAIYIKNKTLFSETANKGILGLLSDWRNKYGKIDLKKINRLYSMTQITWLMNEIKQSRIQFLDQLDSRNLVVPKSHVLAYAKLVDKRVNWVKIQKYVDSRDKSALMTYLSR